MWKRTIKVKVRARWRSVTRREKQDDIWHVYSKKLLWESRISLYVSVFRFSRWQLRWGCICHGFLIEHSLIRNPISVFSSDLNSGLWRNKFKISGKKIKWKSLIIFFFKFNASNLILFYLWKKNHSFFSLSQKNKFIGHVLHRKFEKLSCRNQEIISFTILFFNLLGKIKNSYFPF